MKLMAIDPGSRRHGMAVCDPLGLSVTPMEAVDAADAAAAASRIALVASERDVERIVVGLPVNMDGSEGPAAGSARALGRQLAEATGLPVDFWDERLTTQEAARNLRESGLSGSKRRKLVDSASAAVILRCYIDAKGREKP